MSARWSHNCNNVTISMQICVTFCELHNFGARPHRSKARPRMQRCVSPFTLLGHDVIFWVQIKITWTVWQTCVFSRFAPASFMFGWHQRKVPTSASASVNIAQIWVMTSPKLIQFLLYQCWRHFVPVFPRARKSYVMPYFKFKGLRDVIQNPLTKWCHTKQWPRNMRHGKGNTDNVRGGSLFSRPLVDFYIYISLL